MEYKGPNSGKDSQVKGVFYEPETPNRWLERATCLDQVVKEKNWIKGQIHLQACIFVFTSISQSPSSSQNLLVGEIHS